MGKEKVIVEIFKLDVDVYVYLKIIDVGMIFLNWCFVYYCSSVVLF